MNRVLVLLLILNFFFVLFGNAITPLLSDYVLTIGGKIADAGIAYAILTWVAAVTLIVGPKIKKYFQISDNTFLYISFFSQILAAIWYIYLDQVYEFFILQALLAISSALSIPVVFKWFQDFLKESYATRGWGLRKSTLAGATGLGAIISSHLVYENSYLRVFYFTLADAIFTFILLIITIKVYYKDLPRKAEILDKEQ